MNNNLIKLKTGHLVPVFVMGYIVASILHCRDSAMYAYLKQHIFADDAQEQLCREAGLFVFNNYVFNYASPFFIEDFLLSLTCVPFVFYVKKNEHKKFPTFICDETPKSYPEEGEWSGHPENVISYFMFKDEFVLTDEYFPSALETYCGVVKSHSSSKIVKDKLEKKVNKNKNKTSKKKETKKGMLYSSIKKEKHSEKRMEELRNIYKSFSPMRKNYWRTYSQDNELVLKYREDDSSLLLLQEEMMSSSLAVSTVDQYYSWRNSLQEIERKAKETKFNTNASKKQFYQLLHETNGLFFQHEKALITRGLIADNGKYDLFVGLNELEATEEEWRSRILTSKTVRFVIDVSKLNKMRNNLSPALQEKLFNAENKDRDFIELCIKDESLRLIFLNFLNNKKKFGKEKAVALLQEEVAKLSFEDQKKFDAVYQSLSFDGEIKKVITRFNKDPFALHTNLAKLAGKTAIDAVKLMISKFISDSSFEKDIKEAGKRYTVEEIKDEMALFVWVLIQLGTKIKNKSDLISILHSSTVRSVYPKAYAVYGSGDAYKKLVEYGLFSYVTPFKYDGTNNVGLSRRCVFSPLFTEAMEGILLLDVLHRIQEGENYEYFVYIEGGNVYAGSNRVHKSSNVFDRLIKGGQQACFKFIEALKSLPRMIFSLTKEEAEIVKDNVVTDYTKYVFGEDFGSPKEEMYKLVGDFFSCDTRKELVEANKFMKTVYQLHKEDRYYSTLFDFKAIFSMFTCRKYDKEARADYISVSASGRVYFADGRNNISTALKSILEKHIKLVNFDFVSAHMMTALNMAKILIEVMKKEQKETNSLVKERAELRKELIALNKVDSDEYVYPALEEMTISEGIIPFSKMTKCNQFKYLNDTFSSPYQIQRITQVIWYFETTIEEYEMFEDDSFLGIIPIEHQKRRREIQMRIKEINSILQEIPEDSFVFLTEVMQKKDAWSAIAKEQNVSRKTAKLMVSILDGAGDDCINDYFRKENQEFDVSSLTKWSNGKRSVTYAVYTVLKFLYKNIDRVADIMSDLNMKFMGLTHNDIPKEEGQWLCAGYTFFNKEGLIKPQLAANMFQGQDAMFAHKLIQFSHDKLGLRVWSHEHDGLTIFSDEKYSVKELERLFNAELQEMVNQYFGTTDVVYMNKIEHKHFNEEVFNQYQLAA